MVKNNKSIIIFSTVALLLLLFLFNKLLFGANKFIGPDALSPAAIAQGIESAEIETGDYPQWLPWIFSGLPSTHSMQNISKFYLPELVIHFFENLGLARIWNYILHFIFGGLGCFLLLKRLKTDTYSAIYGGLAFMLTPYLITMVVHGHGSQMMTSVYIPWIIWGIHRLQANPGIMNLGIFSLLIGLQLQRAHVQIAYYTWMLAGLYILILIFRKPVNNNSKLKINLFVIVGFVIGLGMAMSIYLPALEYTPFSIRGADSGGGTGFNYATLWSFSLQEMMTFILPSALGFGSPTYWGDMPFTDYPNYMGILVLILAIFGAIKSKGSETLLFILGGVFAIILAFGKNFSLVYGIFYDYFPYFNKFRVPVMILILTQFSTAMLSGIGFFHLRNILKEKVTIKHLQMAIGCIAIFGIIHLMFGADLIKSIFLPAGGHPKITQVRLEMFQQDMWVFISILGIFIGILWCWQKEFLRWNQLAIVIIAISVCDLCITDIKIIEPEKESLRSKTLYPSRLKRQYLKTDEIINFLKQDTSDFRIFPVGKLANENRWAAFHLESIMGYHPAKLHNYNELISKVGFQYPGVLQMLNVKYLISMEPLNHPLFSQVFKGKLYYQGQYTKANIYEYMGYLERAFFIEKLTKISENTEQYELFQKISFSPVTESFIKSELDKTDFQSTNRNVHIMERTADEIQLESFSESEQFLVLSEVYYPEGWIAYLDDIETEILEVNTVLRGISVPKGSHKIRFTFDPQDIRLGSLISLTCILLTFTCIGIGIYRKI